MRRLVCLVFFGFVLCAALSADAASGRVMKVLPHLLDTNGVHSVSPSLFDRDAYQAWLRQQPPEMRSGVRFDVQWKARGARGVPLKLRVELRGLPAGGLPGETVLEKEVQPRGWFSRWTSLPLVGEEYKKVGDVTAWRVTLWQGGQLLSEQKSFLW